MTPLDVAGMRKAIAEHLRRITLAQGELRSLAARKAELENSVGLAKGRLDRRKEVEAFIEALQAEAHSKRVGDFERLLSALVSQVLPGEMPIALELEIDRGQPSLNIVSRVSADLMEDIFEDQGGALTNIVVLGLRMIAVVKSGMRRFLVLDEPDCWVKNDRIPAFYSVVKEAARKVGVQCFVISHHETTQFAEGISVSKIHGHPKKPGGVHIENNPRPYHWTDEEEGFRYIRLINFQGYIDETLNLTPHVNALTGGNNLGKSSLVRAMRAVFYGESRDALIRRGEKQCTVELGLGSGYVLQWTRIMKSHPTWRLLGPDGAVVTERVAGSGVTMHYETAKQKMPPDWVLDKIGIGRIAGLDPHVIKQKTPVFLLDQSGQTRASVLSIGQEASHIREMIKAYKKMCEQDNLIVREGEAEMGRLMARVVKLEALVDLEEKVDALTVVVDGVERRTAENLRVDAILARVAKTEASVEKTRKSIAVLARLPDESSLRLIEGGIATSSRLADTLVRAERAKLDRERSTKYIAVVAKLPEAVPEIVYSDDLIRGGKLVKDTMTAIERHRAAIATLVRLPDELPRIVESAEINKALDTQERLRNALAAVRASKARLDEEVASSEKLMADELEANGNACPTCGSHVEGVSVFFAHPVAGHGGHAHA